MRRALVAMIVFIAALALGGAAQASWGHDSSGTVNIVAGQWQKNTLSGAVTWSPYHGGFNATLTITNTGSKISSFKASFPVTADKGTMVWAPTGNNSSGITVTYANGVVTVTGTTDGVGWWDNGNDSFQINLQGTDDYNNGMDITYTAGTVTFG